MSINHSKTKAMLCNSRRKWDFVPELNLSQQGNIEVVDQIKVVGFIMRSDMKTSSNTSYLTSKAYKRMWLLRRLKALGASTQQLLDTMEKQVLSTLWLGAPAWFLQITLQEKTNINRVAKVGLRIIYGQHYDGFQSALLRANMRRPTDQLASMTVKFAEKCAKNAKFSQWFKLRADPNMSSRTAKSKYLPVPARTTRFENSPIPQLTNILNAKSLQL